MPRKIIYFDRETIKNMLQERNRGTKIKTTGVEGEANVAVTAKAEASSSIYLGVPFFARVKFLITGTLQSQFLLKYDSSTTITSTEISDFESIQKDFVEFKDKQVFDIENSYRITKKEIHDRKPEYSEFFTEEDLYKFVSPRIKVNGENARTIKNKIQFAIEELMFQYSGCNT